MLVNDASSFFYGYEHHKMFTKCEVLDINDYQTKKYFTFESEDNRLVIDYKKPATYIKEFNDNLLSLIKECIADKSFSSHESLLSMYKEYSKITGVDLCFNHYHNVWEYDTDHLTKNDINYNKRLNIPGLLLKLSNNLGKRERHLLYRLNNCGIVQVFHWHTEHTIEIIISPVYVRDIISEWYIHKYVRNSLASSKIERAWNRCRADPRHPLGIKRLTKELEELNTN